ncbi:MAG: PAS domain-containing sensor histidine kinase, partial [Xanthomonadaceae bacterium]|nr:PAS domain-containing sensor histidine kinase [Xanthomonadaceae bacterium]
MHELTNSTPSYAPFGLKDMPSGTHPWVDANEAPQLARILDAVPQLVWTASVDGRLLYCNSEVRRRLGPCEGLAVEHIIPMKLVAPGDRGRWLGTWRRALEYGQSYEMEYTALTQQDSRARWYLERGTRIDADGASDRWFVTATRIDEQKRREEELVGMLLRKERFLVTLLHELRNPLAPIANATELLEKHSADPGAVISARGVIGRQLQQLTRLVDDLLDVSRIARGGVTLHRAPTDLREIIAVAIETAQPLIEERRHRLAAGTPAEAVMVNGDRARLCQVFSNLLINAAKYTNPGGRIDVALETRLGVAIGRIRDNGIGLRPTSCRASSTCSRKVRPPAPPHRGAWAWDSQSPASWCSSTPVRFPHTATAPAAAASSSCAYRPSSSRANSARQGYVRSSKDAANSQRQAEIAFLQTFGRVVVVALEHVEAQVHVARDIA